MLADRQQSCLNFRCLCLLVIVFVLAILGLLAYIAYVEADEDRDTDINEVFEDDNDRSDETMGLEDVIHFYGDFFRTPREQIAFERKYLRDPYGDLPLKTPGPDPSVFLQVCSNITNQEMMNSSTGNQTIDWIPPDTSTQNQPTLPAKNRTNLLSRRKRGINTQYMYHGCCISRKVFISPDTATSATNGKELTLVQFGDRRQYFSSEKCWQATNCDLKCGCRSEVSLVRALVHHPNRNRNGYAVKEIRIPGCCKCHNNYDP